MVAAVRQIVTVQANGRLEIISPELRAGTVTEVIVLLLPQEESRPTPAERVAELSKLRTSIGLTTQTADDWVREVRSERGAWNPAADV